LTVSVGFTQNAFHPALGGTYKKEIKVACVQIESVKTDSN